MNYNNLSLCGSQLNCSYTYVVKIDFIVVFFTTISTISHVFSLCALLLLLLLMMLIRE